MSFIDQISALKTKVSGSVSSGIQGAKNYIEEQKDDSWMGRALRFAKDNPTPVDYAKKYFQPTAQVRARDVIREIPQATYNLIPNLSKKITPETILDFSIRPAARGATSVIKTFTGDKSAITPTTIPEKVFYGDKPVGDIYQAGGQFTKDIGFEAKPKTPLGQAGLGLLGATMSVMDTFTGGGKNKLGEQIVKITTREGAERFIKKMGLKATDELISKIINTRTLKEADKLIGGLAGKTTQLIREQDENLMLGLEEVKDRFHDISTKTKNLDFMEMQSQADDIIKKLANNKKITDDERKTGYEIIKRAETFKASQKTEAVRKMMEEEKRRQMHINRGVESERKRAGMLSPEEKSMILEEAGIIPKTATPTKEALGKTAPSSVLSTPAMPKKTSKLPQSFQKDISYLDSISKPKISQASPFINTDKLNISDESKKFINKTIEEAKPQFEEALGKTLTNKEMVEFADKTSQTLNRVIGRKQTKEFEAALLNTRRKLATLAESGTVDKEYLETLKTVKTIGADIARKLQSFSVEAGTTSLTKQKILEAILKVNDDTDEILKAAKGVDFTDANQAVDFYRKFIKPTAGEWIDLIRYNSMLSSPTTHIINMASNLINSSVVAPIEKTITGTLDFLGGVVGKERKAFAGEGIAYLGGYAKNIGDASHRFADVMTGKRQFTNLDLKFIPVASKGAKGMLTKALSIPTRLLEASDQFFTALSEGGEKAALGLRESKGVKTPLLEMKAKEKAAYRLFRQDLFDKNQGHLLDAIDQFTSKLMSLRNNKNPIVSNIAKFTVPFVKTPMNIFKQGLEYSPAGFATAFGSKNKMEQISKAIIGSSVFAGAATMLSSGRLTWGEPTGEKQRQEWRQAGVQPYSVKIGDKWYSYQKLVPSAAFPIAMVAAIDDMQKRKKLDDSTTEMILGSIAKYGEFLADQSYVKSIGDLLSAAKGGEAGIARVIGNYPQQLIPLRALGGWLARLTDDEQRKVDNKADFIDKQVQLLMMNIPGISKKVPARLDVEGNPIPNRNRFINAFSPVKVSTEDKKFKGLLEEAEAKRKSQKEHSQKLEKAKEEVLNSGQYQKVDDTFVYKEGGKIKTTVSENAVRAKEIVNLPPQERAKRLVEEIKRDPKFAVQYKRAMAEKDMTDDEIEMKNSSIAERAEKIKEAEAGMSKEERDKFRLELIKKKIITKDVLKQLML